MLSVVTDFADTHLLGVGAAGEVLTHRLFVPFVFGLYVGMKEIHQSGGWHLHIVGLLAGISAGLLSYAGWIYLGSVPEPMEGSVVTIDRSHILVDVLVTYVFSIWLVFISGVLLGRGVQLKAEQERWGAQNVSEASEQQGQSVGAWNARTTTLLGLIGVLGAALMQSIAAVLAAIFGGH